MKALFRLIRNRIKSIAKYWLRTVEAQTITNLDDRLQLGGGLDSF